MSPASGAIDARGDLPEALFRQFEQACKGDGTRLTAGRIRVYAQLLQLARPVTAYELVALLEKRERRKLSPVSVYRQLEFLRQKGLVYRLASTHAFVACQRPDRSRQLLILVCSVCGSTHPLASGRLRRRLDEVAQAIGFASEARIVEVHGTCRHCGPDGAAPGPLKATAAGAPAGAASTPRDCTDDAARRAENAGCRPSRP